MRTAITLLLVTISGFAGCLDDTNSLPTIPGPATLDDQYVGETVQFLLIGDQGTQMQDQYDTAEAMLTTCTELVCDFVVALGDNIYSVGPILGTFDPQFALAFEDPYADFDIPFYLTLGNHDNGATGHVVVHGDYEVAYTYSDESSGKWQMPSRYYNATFNDGFLEMWSLDGDTLTAGDSTSGIRLGPDVIYSRDEQVEWMTESIENSDAHWKIAFSHYQYMTEGYKGDSDPYYQEAIEEFVCDKTHFFFYGHQHQLRWTEEIEGCPRTEHINSGAGARNTNEGTPGGSDVDIEQHFVYDQGAGYWWVELSGDTMTAIAYGTADDDPTEPVELFRRTVTKAELGW
jgi:tartrate-resistant acid phosphatase type 5